MCPKIVALCPTYGRVSKLCQALAWWDMQTWQNKQLIILNDAPVPLSCNMPTVSIVNAPSQFLTLGAKRQHLLNLAVECGTKYVCHYDDDDIYLKWYLESLVIELETGAPAVKPRLAYAGMGYDDDIVFNGPEDNVFEAQLGMNLSVALSIGYVEKQVGETIPLLECLSSRRQCKLFDPPRGWCMVCRYGDGLVHTSQLPTIEQFMRNEDFGDGTPLEPADVSSIIEQIIAAGIPVD